MLEASTVVRRAIEGKPTVFSIEMTDKVTTMTWAGDVAKMIMGLIDNKKALGEDFNVVSSESRRWSEVIKYYQELVGLKLKYISLDRFLGIYNGKYQVMYDRMYNRTMDNTKVLEATGLSQSDFISLRSGLNLEVSRFIKKPIFNNSDEALNSRIDNITDNTEQRIRKKLRPRSRLSNLRDNIRPRSRLINLKRKLRIRTRINQALKTQSNKKKDGLIVTLASVFNYGNILQRYALKTYLKKNGYNFDSIEMQSWVDGVSDSIFGETRRFVTSHIGGIGFEPNQLQGYKNYIVGSDQVWRNWHKGRWDLYSLYFLDFVRSDNARRVGYAASFGVDTLKAANIDDETADKIRPLLAKFDSVSVREESGVKLVRKILNSKGREVGVALDPTLLLNELDYSALIDSSEYADTNIAKVFCYILDQTDTKKELIKRIARLYENSYQIINPDVSRRYESVELWLKGFRDSQFIITDSFHGTVFAILNSKNFLVFNNESRGSARFETLLTSLGISRDRIIDDATVQLDLDSIPNIDWPLVSERLNDM